jgi:dienelactone hydrolase
VGSYGGKDRTPMGRSAAPRLEHALTALGVDHDVKVYLHAGHGFINDHDPADATLLLIFLAKISGTAITRHPPTMHAAASPPFSARTSRTERRRGRTANHGQACTQEGSTPDLVAPCHAAMTDQPTDG